MGGKVESVKLDFADKNMTIIIVLWCFVDKKNRTAPNCWEQPCLSSVYELNLESEANAY